jgi:hypothetical protein
MNSYQRFAVGRRIDLLLFKTPKWYFETIILKKYLKKTEAFLLEVSLSFRSNQKFNIPDFAGISGPE